MAETTLYKNLYKQPGDVELDKGTGTIKSPRYRVKLTITGYLPWWLDRDGHWVNTGQGGGIGPNYQWMTERAARAVLAKAPILEVPVCYLWTRIGDAGDYSKVCASDEDEPLRQMVEHWRECLVTGDKLTVRSDGCGAEVGGYTGQDYLSVYWGDGAGEMVRPLSDDEREELAGWWTLYNLEPGNPLDKPIVPELYVVRLDTSANYRDGAPHPPRGQAL